MSALTGKTILVTGANSGIGLEASVKLAKEGATLVMVARDPQRGEAALADVKARSGSQDVTLLQCDFAKPAEIRALAEKFRASHDRLDVLVNNAGLVNAKRQVTESGVENTFAVNHLGYFLLTSLLLDLIKKSAPSRIVNVASVGHYNGTLDWDNLQFEKGGYAIMAAYSRSKLANVMFTKELARRLEGTGVTVNSLHPGAVATNIWAGAPRWAAPLLSVAKRIFMISPDEGSKRIVYLASSPEVSGKTGGYYDKDRLKAPNKLAEDAALCARLWTVSEQLVADKTPERAAT